MAKSDDPSDALANDDKLEGNRRLDIITEKSRSVRDQLTGQMKALDSKRALDAVLEAPKRFKREWQKTGATGAMMDLLIDERRAGAAKTCKAEGDMRSTRRVREAGTHPTQTASRVE